LFGLAPAYCITKFICKEKKAGKRDELGVAGMKAFNQLFVKNKKNARFQNIL